MYLWLGRARLNLWANRPQVMKPSLCPSHLDILCSFVFARSSQRASDIQHAAVSTVTHSSPFTPEVLVGLAWWHVRQKGILGGEFMAWAPLFMHKLIKQSCCFQQTWADLNTPSHSDTLKQTEPKGEKLNSFYKSHTQNTQLDLSQQQTFSLYFSKSNK